MQGFVVVPLFVGYDIDADAGEGRAGSSPTTPPGGRYDELSGLPRHRLRLGVREVGAEEAPRPDRRPARPPSAPPSRRSTTPPTTTPPPAGPTSPAGSSRVVVDHHRRRGRGAPPRGGDRGGRARRSSPAAPRTPADDRPRAPLPTRRTRSPSRDDAVLLLGRPAAARPLGAGAQGHRPRPQRRRADLHRRRAVRRGEPLHRAAQGLRDLRPDRLRRGRAATTSSRTCAPPASGWPTCAATPTTAATSPAGGWPTPTPRCWAPRSSSSRSPTRWSCAWPRWAPTPDGDQLYRITYDGSITDEPQFVVMGGTTEPISAKLKETYRAGLELGEAIGHRGGGACRPARPTGNGGTGRAGARGAARWRSRCSTAPARGAPSAASPARRCASCCPEANRGRDAAAARRAGRAATTPRPAAERSNGESSS